MSIVLLQVELTLTEFNQLSKEFPQLVFLSFARYGQHIIGPEHWQQAEIYFGDKITCEQIQMAPNLRWIHLPIVNLHHLCMEEINRRGNILLSNTREENAFQIGEYVLSAVLAFAKNLFIWKEMASHSSRSVWSSKWRNKMWSLKDKIFLQIGMDKVGTEIIRRAENAGMKVWFLDVTQPYHASCQKFFSIDQLHEILPQVDVVSMVASRDKPIKLGRKELELMKEDSILSIIGYRQQIDEAAIEELCQRGKFRGVILDAFFHTPISSSSKLWNIPRFLLTPEVSPRPKSGSNEAFRIFRFNLRQFLHENFSDMKNLIDPSSFLH